MCGENAARVSSPEAPAFLPAGAPETLPPVAPPPVLAEGDGAAAEGYAWLAPTRACHKRLKSSSIALFLFPKLNLLPQLERPLTHRWGSRGWRSSLTRRWGWRWRWRRSGGWNDGGRRRYGRSRSRRHRGSGRDGRGGRGGELTTSWPALLRSPLLDRSDGLVAQRPRVGLSEGLSSFNVVSDFGGGSSVVVVSLAQDVSVGFCLCERDGQQGEEGEQRVDLHRARVGECVEVAVGGRCENECG